jgi:hypothetical protein
VKPPPLASWPERTGTEETPANGFLRDRDVAARHRHELAGAGAAVRLSARSIAAGCGCMRFCGLHRSRELPDQIRDKSACTPAQGMRDGMDAFPKGRNNTGLRRSLGQTRCAQAY